MKRQNNFFTLKLFLPLAAMIIIVFSVLLKSSYTSNFRLNEVSFINNDGNDWIEIYNPGLNTRSLKGMYLSDDKDEFTKFIIDKEIIIPPNGFVVIYGKDYKEEKDEDVLKTNFNIKNGETIYLVDQDKMAVDSLTVIADNGSSEDIAICRYPDGSDKIFLTTSPTKGEKNIENNLTEINSEI